MLKGEVARIEAQSAGSYIDIGEENVLLGMIRWCVARLALGALFCFWRREARFWRRFLDELGPSMLGVLLGEWGFRISDDTLRPIFGLPAWFPAVSLCWRFALFCFLYYKFVRCALLFTNARLWGREFWMWLYGYLSCSLALLSVGVSYF